MQSDRTRQQPPPWLIGPVAHGPVRNRTNGWHHTHKLYDHRRVDSSRLSAGSIPHVQLACSCKTDQLNSLPIQHLELEQTRKNSQRSWGNDQLSIWLSKHAATTNQKRFQSIANKEHVLKRLVSTVRFCPSAPYIAYLEMVLRRMVAPQAHFLHSEEPQ